MNARFFWLFTTQNLNELQFKLQSKLPPCLSTSYFNMHKQKQSLGYNK